MSQKEQEDIRYPVISGITSISLFIIPCKLTPLQSLPLLPFVLSGGQQMSRENNVGGPNGNLRFNETICLLASILFQNLQVCNRCQKSDRCLCQCVYNGQISRCEGHYVMLRYRKNILGHPSQRGPVPCLLSQKTGSPEEMHAGKINNGA